jgi:hypothetical protein
LHVVQRIVDDIAIIDFEGLDGSLSVVEDEFASVIESLMEQGIQKFVFVMKDLHQPQLVRGGIGTLVKQVNRILTAGGSYYYADLSEEAHVLFFGANIDPLPPVADTVERAIDFLSS